MFRTLSVSHSARKLFDLSMLVLVYQGISFFPARLDIAAQMKADPVPATNIKKAQLNLQCPSL